jgi:hypothetical protein
MFVRILLLTAVLGLLSACGVRQNLRPDEPVQLSGTEAILLMGMQPAGYRLHLLRGKVDEGHWVRPTVDVPEVNIEAEAGFIMVKVAPTLPGERMGVATVFPGSNQAYGPCNGTASPTFELKPGVVNYVGDLSYALANRKLSYAYSENGQQARKFLAERFPSLVPKLAVTGAQIMPVRTGFCNPTTITIPVYINRR